MYVCILDSRTTCCDQSQRLHSQTLTAQNIETPNHPITYQITLEHVLKYVTKYSSDTSTYQIFLVH